MQRPDYPHKKTLAVIGLTSAVLIMTWRIDSIPDWIAGIGFGLFAIFDLYVLYWAIRQGLWAFTATNVGLLLAIGTAYFLISTWTPGSTDPDSAPVWTDAALYALIVLSAFILLFDIVACFYLLRRKRYPRQSAEMRRLFWPVNIGLNLIALAIVLLMLYY